jgi:hypothetical protein
MKPFLLLRSLVGVASLAVVFVSPLIHSGALASTIDWKGGYRIEYTEVDRPSLADPGNKKSYGLQYLYLNPKIVASDGINIISRFDILGSDIAAYRNSQLGSFVGKSLSTNAGSHSTAQQQESSELRVSQLYLSVNHEYGALVAGRSPIEFGLGVTHNAGLGAFDHWGDTKDMIGYKFIIDNTSFMPIYTRNKQTDFEIGRTISEQIYVLEYDNKDIGAKVGVFHQAMMFQLGLQVFRDLWDPHQGLTRRRRLIFTLSVVGRHLNLNLREVF